MFKLLIILFSVLFCFITEYYSEEGLPRTLNVVKYVQTQMAHDPLLVHEYLPILGLTNFCEAAMEFCLGKDSTAIVENRVRKYFSNNLIHLDIRTMV